MLFSVGKVTLESLLLTANKFCVKSNISPFPCKNQFPKSQGPPVF